MSLYSALTQVLAPFAAKIKGIQTGYDGTVYPNPGTAVREQIKDLHVMIGDVPGAAIQASAVAYGNSDVGTELTAVNGRLDVQQSAIGDLSQLQTENKTDLVSAINEAAQSGGAAIDIDTSLEKNGWAADAAEVGVKIAAVNFDLVVDALGNATITRNDYIDTRKVKY